MRFVVILHNTKFIRLFIYPDDNICRFNRSNNEFIVSVDPHGIFHNAVGQAKAQIWTSGKSVS